MWQEIAGAGAMIFRLTVVLLTLAVACASDLPSQPAHAQQQVQPRNTARERLAAEQEMRRREMREVMILAPERPTRKVAYDSLAITVRPPAATLHHSLDGIDLPAGGMQVRLTCIADIGVGRLGACQPRDAGPIPNVRRPSPFRSAAARVNVTRFAPKPETPERDAYVLVDIDVALAASDRVQTGQPANVLKADEVDWERAPPKDGLFSFFNLSVLDRTVTLTTTCQIQADLSLVCVKASFDPQGESVEDDNPFVFAPVHTSRAALKDGTPAAGQWIDVTYQLKPTPVLIAPQAIRPPPPPAN